MYLIANSGSDTSGNFEMKYVCPKCAYEIKNTLNDLVYREPLFQSNHSVTNYGWICPKCGAVLSPSTQECPYCTPYKVTCGTINEFPIKPLILQVKQQPKLPQRLQKKLQLVKKQLLQPLLKKL